MSTTDENIQTIKREITNLYPADPKFFQLYAGDIIISIIIIFIFMVFITFFLIANQFPEIKKNWANERCNPLYVPLAGFIINDPNKSKWDVANETFVDCVQNILVSIIHSALQPIYYAISVISDTIKDAIKAINSIRALFNKTRNSLGTISKSITSKALNFTIPFTKMVIVVKDTIAKSIGILVTNFFISIDSFLTIKSTIQSIFLIILDYIIVPTAATLIYLLSLAAGAGPFALVYILAAAILTILLTALLAIFIPVNMAASFVLGVKPAIIPNYS